MNRTVKKKMVKKRAARKTVKNPQLMVINPPLKRATRKKVTGSGSKGGSSKEALAAFKTFHECEPSAIVKVGKGSEPLIALGQVHTIIYAPRIGARSTGLYRHKFRAGSATLVTDLQGNLSILPRGKRPYRVDFKRGIIG